MTAFGPDGKPTNQYLTREMIEKAIEDIRNRPDPPLLLHPDEYARHKKAAAEYEEMVGFKHAFDLARRYKGLAVKIPVRIEVTREMYAALKRTLSAPEYGHLGINPAWVGIPVIVDEDVPEPGWRFIYPECDDDEHESDAGGFCKRCRKEMTIRDYEMRVERFKSEYQGDWATEDET